MTASKAVAYMVLLDFSKGGYWPDEIIQWAKNLMVGEKRVGVELVRQTMVIDAAVTKPHGYVPKLHPSQCKRAIQVLTEWKEEAAGEGNTQAVAAFGTALDALWSVVADQVTEQVNRRKGG